MPKRNGKTTYQQATLPSGLATVLRPMAHVESVAVGMWVKAGGRYEPLPKAGVSHFVEHLLFKGTRTRSCEALKQAIEGVGGGFNGFTAEEFTCYMVKVPARYHTRAITILSDMVLHPAMRPADIEKEREVILEEIRMAEDSPGQYVHEVFNQLMWPNHPLGSLLAGTIETVKGFTRRDIVEYWRRMYHPRNLLVSCAGAFEPGRALRQLGSTFARAPKGRVFSVVPAPRPGKGPQVKVLHKETEQTHLCVGTPALARMHPLRFALELLHVILGANMSSRLFREVREKRALVYEIGTHVKRYQDTGAFVVYAGCDAGKLETTLRTVMAELARIKRERVPMRELQRAKDFYRGQLTMSLEDTMEQMLWMGEQAVTVGRVAQPKDLLQALDRVTPQQIKRAAQLLFASPRLFLAVVGPIQESEASRLRSLCEVPLNVKTIIAPSLLACDFTRVAEEIKAVEQAGADWLHLDVMDGHFVPNISFGPVIVEAATRVCKLPIDVQLMIEHPEQYLEAFIKAGASQVTVHVEAKGLSDPNVLRHVLQDLRRHNVKAGLSVKPNTPVEALQPYLKEVDVILIMTVEPGFGGQAFLPETLPKIRQVRQWFGGNVEVDGGINADTARQAREAGANCLVAGTYVFRHRDYRAAIDSLR